MLKPSEILILKLISLNDGQFSWYNLDPRAWMNGWRELNEPLSVFEVAYTLIDRGYLRTENLGDGKESIYWMTELGINTLREMGELPDTAAANSPNKPGEASLPPSRTHP